MPQPDKRINFGFPVTIAETMTVEIRNSLAQGSQHFETICILTRDAGTDNCLLISRTNAHDLLLYPASLAQVNQDFPHIVYSRDVTKTMNEVEQAFDDTHDDIPEFDGGDCKDFAGRAYQKLTGHDDLGVTLTDDFM